MKIAVEQETQNDNSVTVLPVRILVDSSRQTALIGSSCAMSAILDVLVSQNRSMTEHS